MVAARLIKTFFISQVVFFVLLSSAYAAEGINPDFGTAVQLVPERNLKLKGADLAQAQETKLGSASGHDVMSSKVTRQHEQWMVGYEYLLESMDGNRDRTRRVGHGKVLERFFTAPTEGIMEMHMPMVMYAPTEDLSLMAMVPYMRKSMKHITRDGVRFTERSEGIGDVQVRGLYTFWKLGGLQHRFLFNAALSFPTGSIDKKDFGPDRIMGRMRLEYPMQLGSGTVDLLPGLTYLGEKDLLSWGAEFIPTVRVGRNSHNYRLGNRYRLSGWGAWKWIEWLSLTGRIDGQIWQNIHGFDRVLDPMDEPTKDPSIQGGKRVDLMLGVNLYVPEGLLKGNRLSAEVGRPLYQFLDGPQLKTNWLLRVAWQWAF